MAVADVAVTVTVYLLKMVVVDVTLVVVGFVFGL